MLLPYFGYIAKFTKFTRGSCLPSLEKSKAEESLCKKKKERKSRPKEERKSTILSRKEKKSCVKVTGTS